MAGIHDHHRERVRKEFLTRGFNENTPEHKLLEMLLFYSIPRKDTNELAHILINRFGSFAALLEADTSELLEINGIGENTAALIKLILPLAGAYERQKAAKNKKFNNTDEVYDYIRRKYYGITKETFSVLSFDSSGRITGFDFLSSGDVSSVGITSRMVMETVLKRKAVTVIIAHNHPGDSLLPSSSDIAVTEMLINALAQVNIRLIDHLIICDNDYVSFNQSSNLQYMFKRDSAEA